MPIADTVMPEAHPGAARRVTPADTLRWLTLLGFLLATGVLALGAAVLLDARRDAWHQAERSSNNLATALARDIARTIAIYDLSLRGAIQALGRPGLDQVSPDIRQLAIFDRAAGADYLGSILVLDPSGDVVADSTSVHPHRLNLAERDYFQVHRDRADAGLFLSLPFRSKLRDGDPSVAISRRLTRPDGSFGGAVVGTLRLAYFQDLLEKLEVGQAGSITVMRADGKIIARHPSRESDLSLDLSRSETALRFLKAPTGQFTAPSSVDGVTRLFTYRGVGDLPLLVNVARSTDEVYRAWRTKAWVIGSILGILSAAMTALSLLFRREMQGRLRAEAALRASADRLQVIASTDALTTLANRRAFEEALHDAWRRAVRTQEPLALMIIDADCFKAFNDAHGHPEGDRVLQAVACCISRCIRTPEQTAARYGGEEFVVLLPGTDSVGALSLAERLRAEVAALGIAHPGSPAGWVTVSVGVAVARPRFGEASALLVREADAALYDAKHSGRNRVCAAGPGDRQAVV